MAENNTAKDKDPVNRREFLGAGLRYAALAGLGLLGVKLARRSGSGATSSEVCTSDGICRRCPSLEGCRLPQALSTRTVLSGSKD